LLSQRLGGHDPNRLFRRGAVLLSRGADAVTSVQQLQPGDFVSLTLRDGTAQASILQTKEHGKKTDGKL